MGASGTSIGSSEVREEIWKQENFRRKRQRKRCEGVCPKHETEGDQIRLESRMRFCRYQGVCRETVGKNSRIQGGGNKSREARGESIEKRNIGTISRKIEEKNGI